MDAKKLSESGNEQYIPNLDAQDEEVLSGGNNRLMYILVGIMLALVIAYVAVPRTEGSALASVTPSFMLDDAAVTATLPTSEDSIAAGLKAAPVAAPATVAKPTALAVNKSIDAAKRSNSATPAAAVPAQTVAAAPAPAPSGAPAAAAPAAAPAPVAPATVIVKGRIDNENGEPLVGATVLLQGSSKGTSTDANGNYSLEVPSGNENTLIYGYGGYEDESIHVRRDQAVNVTLTPRAKEKKRRK